MTKRKICIIDDDPLQVQLLKQILELHDYEVIYAHDGAQGYKKVQEEKPDLVLVDLIMPGMDGFELCKKLKSQTDTMAIPLIMCSGSEVGAVAIDEPDLQLESYIEKPCKEKDLIAAIKKALGEG